MNSSIYINTALGSCIMILLIAVDYLRKFNTDLFQRRLMIAMLCAAFVSVILDFTGRLIGGSSGTLVHKAMFFLISFYLVTQCCCYCLSAVFADYFTYNSQARTRKFAFVVCVFPALYAISVTANLFFSFYFTISPDNIFMPGKFYIPGLLFSFVPLLITIADISHASKYFRQSQAYLVVFFIFITGAGAALDAVLKTSSLVWPCYSASILYIYFFIIRSDSKIDSLTGIGNRNSFNEFFNRLSRQNTREEYSIVMFDLDRFKEINDTLGHVEGDNALRDMAAIIKGCIRHSDFAARFGGDEFVLAARADNDIKRILDRISESINTQNQMKVRPYQLHMSYGYDVYTTNSGQSIHDFLAHVDKLMYRQKEENRAERVSAITLKA